MSLNEIRGTPYYTKYVEPEEEPIPSSPPQRQTRSSVPSWKHGPDRGTATQPTPLPTQPTTPFPSNAIPEWKHGPDIDTAIQPTPITEHQKYHYVVWQKNMAPSGRVLSQAPIIMSNIPGVTQAQYEQYSREIAGLSNEQRLLLGFTGTNPANIPLAYEMAFGSRQRAQDIRVKSWMEMKSWYGPKGEMSLEGFGRSYISSPITQIGLTAATMGGYGAASGAARGYLLARGSLRGLKAFTTAEKVAGIGLGGYAAYDVGKTFQTQGTAQGLGKTWVVGTAFTTGAMGYNLGMPRGYRYGAQKGYEKFLASELKTGRITQPTYKAALEGSRARYSIEKQIQHFTVKQPTPKFTDIQSFQSQPKLRAYFQNKLKTGKGEIFGGASSNKPQGTHDLDVMLKPKEHMFARYVSKDYLKIGEASQYADIKAPQRPGQVVGEMGSIKMKPLRIEGYRVMRWTEQFSRLSGSSLRPAHSGRVKDIPESVRMLDQIIAGKRVSSKIQSDIMKYDQSMRYLESLGEKNPLIRSATQSEQIYGPSFSDKFYKTRMRFWEKAMPESMKRADASRYISGGGKVRSSSYDGFLPPSMRSSLSPRFYGGYSLSSFLPSSVIKSVSKSVSSSFSFPSSSFYSPSKTSSFLKSFAYTPSSRSYTPKLPSISRPYTSPKISPPYTPPYKSPPYSSIPYSSSYSPPYSSPPYFPPSYPITLKSFKGVYSDYSDMKEYGTRYKFREFHIPELRL